MKASIQIELDNPSQSISILETEREENQRSTVKFSKSGNDIKITITADNSTTLLSSIGSTIRKLTVIENVSKTIEKNNKKAN